MTTPSSKNTMRASIFRASPSCRCRRIHGRGTSPHHQHQHHRQPQRKLAGSRLTIR
jgi:hypothetical protein